MGLIYNYLRKKLQIDKIEKDITVLMLYRQEQEMIKLITYSKNKNREEEIG